MILFDEKNSIFKIDTVNTSYVMGLADEMYLGHVYYGDKLQSTDLTYLLGLEVNPFTPEQKPGEKVSFMDCFPMEYPTKGLGDFRESCLSVKRMNGQEQTELVYKSHVIYKGKQTLEGLPSTWGEDSETLEIMLADEITGIQVTLLYSVFDGIDAVIKSVRVKNTAAEPVFLTKVLSGSLDIRPGSYETLSLHGSWARERHMSRTPIGYGSMGIETCRGISGHQENPFLAVVSEGTTQNTGEVYAMNFVYSSNFMVKVQKNQFDHIRAVMGIHPENFSWKLSAGEVFTAPEVVMVYSGSGLGRMTQTYHDLYRNHLIRSAWKDKMRPVLINNWEATYFNFDTNKLLDIARSAKAHGIEMLVMDDGWFGHRESDNSSLGDWFVNESKIQGGLKYLADEIHNIGLKFGIWFEPEMISPDSELYRLHPEWALRCEGREPGQARNQLVLDLTRPETAEYIYNSIAAILKSAAIEYVKWDMNRPLSDIGSSYLPADQQGEIMHRQMLAVYGMQERLLKDFPELLLENCSGGGARFDPGMLYYSPQFWCSDDTDAVERLIIQEGTQLIYPLSTIGAHVSDCPNHTTGRVTPFSTRGDVALSGTFGYELDITKISQSDRDEIPGQIDKFKKFNPLVLSGDYFRIASYQENHDYDCYQIVSKDKKKSFVTYVQVHAKPNAKKKYLRLQGLVPDGLYQIGEDIYLGDTLMKAGIPVPVIFGDYRSMIIELNLVDSRF